MTEKTSQKLATRNGKRYEEKSTASAPDSLANPSASQEEGEVLRTLEELCFSRLQGRPNKSNHAIYCLRTSKAYYLTKGGRTFKIILSTLDELGYDAEWQVLNSKNFGVPQNRERVFIVGYLRKCGGRQVFPFEKSDSEANVEQEPTVNTIVARYGNSMSAGTYVAESEPQTIIQIGNIKDTDYFGGNPQVGRVYSVNGISPCLDTMSGGGREPKIVIPVLTPERAEKRQNGRRMKEDGEEMFPLTTQDRHGVWDGFHIRKLTPKECWRLQGFPDWAFDRAKEAGISDSQLYKQAGNSVTVNVIREIGRRME